MDSPKPSTHLPFGQIASTLISERELAKEFKPFGVTLMGFRRFRRALGIPGIEMPNGDFLISYVHWLIALHCATELGQPEFLFPGCPSMLHDKKERRRYSVSHLDPNYIEYNMSRIIPLLLTAAKAKFLRPSEIKFQKVFDASIRRLGIELAAYYAKEYQEIVGTETMTIQKRNELNNIQPSKSLQDLAAEEELNEEIQQLDESVLHTLAFFDISELGKALIAEGYSQTERIKKLVDIFKTGTPKEILAADKVLQDTLRDTLQAGGFTVTPKNPSQAVFAQKAETHNTEQESDKTLVANLTKDISHELSNTGSIPTPLDPRTKVQHELPEEEDNPSNSGSSVPTPPIN